MSNTQYAFLKKSHVPSKAALQAAIDAAGFDLQLHPDLDLLSDSGFSPCTLKGTPEVGFELFCEDSEGVTEGDDEFKELAGDNDFCLSFTWRSSAKDMACVMIVSYVLAKDFGAVVSYEGDEPDSLEDMLAGATESIEEAMDDDAAGEPSAEDYAAKAQESAARIQNSLLADGGKLIEQYLNEPDYYNLNRSRMALMELWADGSITARQRKQLTAVDEALFKLKNS